MVCKEVIDIDISPHQDQPQNKTKFFWNYGYTWRATLQSLVNKFKSIQWVSKIWCFLFWTLRIWAKVFKVLDNIMTLVIFLGKLLTQPKVIYCKNITWGCKIIWRKQVRWISQVAWTFGTMNYIFQSLTSLRKHCSHCVIQTCTTNTRTWNVHSRSNSICNN
jgi:hypothetical protein